jgi:hypothetical protein
VKIALDPLDREAVVVEERLPFSWEVLPMSERYDPSFLGVLDRRELGGNEEDLPDPVVVVALLIIHELAGGGVAKARRGVGFRGRTQKVGERGHCEVGDEEPTRGKMRANTREKALHVVPHVEMEHGVERTDDQRKTPAKTDAPHVAPMHSHSCSNLARLCLQTLTEVREHRGRVVDSGNFDPMTGDR